MFDDADVADLDAVGCAAALRAGFVEERAVVARRLLQVAHWADLHTPVEAAPASSGQRVGSHGTPAVSAFAATELGVLLELTTGSARSLLRDVLDLRHRHPLLWRALLDGRVAEWVARRIVRATAEAGLTLDQARRVDARTVGAVCRLPFGRAMALVAARIVEADPEAAEERRRDAMRRRHVSLGRSSCFGLRTLTAQTTGVELARVDGMLDVLAQALADRGDAEPHEVRRAKALGVLANPAVACTLLAATEPDAEPRLQPAQPAAEPPAELTAEPAVELAAELAAAFGRTLLALGPTALDRLRPRSVLYYHLAPEALGDLTLDRAGRPRATCGVARSERDGPLTVPQLREWLEGEYVVVRPVLDPDEIGPVDGYEVPDRMREALVLRRPVEVFPWGTLSSRVADLDHTVPWVSPSRGGPAGQTSPGNLGPLGRSHHNAKTHGGWRLHQPHPGSYYWRTPTGHWSRVDASGTTYLGTRRPGALRGPPPDSPPAPPPAHRRSPGERLLARLVTGDVAAG